MYTKKTRSCPRTQRTTGNYEKGTKQTSILSHTPKIAFWVQFTKSTLDYIFTVTYHLPPDSPQGYPYLLHYYYKHFCACVTLCFLFSEPALRYSNNVQSPEWIQVNSTCKATKRASRSVCSSDHSPVSAVFEKVVSRPAELEYLPCKDSISANME